MNLLQAIVLGIVQGLTEFLPISSSGHLILFPFYMGWKINGSENIPFYVIVHVGTLVAVLAYFRRDVKLLLTAFYRSTVERKIGDDPHRRLAWFLIIGTLPAGIIYIVLNKILKEALETPMLVGIFLIITGFLLVVSERIGKRGVSIRDMRMADAIFVGIAQGFAILPGISRSGSTIAAGLFRGLTREEAARFSFLLSIPVIIAGTLEEFLDLAKGFSHSTEAIILVAGFLTAAITGYLAIKYFIEFLKKYSLNAFALYCFALGAVTVIASTLK